MPTSFTADRYGIAEATPTIPQLRSMVGAYELVFYVQTLVHASTVVWRWLSIQSGRVSVTFAGGVKSELGLAFCDRPTVLRQYEHPSPGGFELRLTISPYQLAKLEDGRNAGDITFTLTMMTKAGDTKDGVYRDPDQQILNIHVPQSEWVKQLGAAGAFDVLLIEVPMPMGRPQADGVGKHLQQAQKHFTHGFYRECVAECRQVAEVLGRDEAGQAIGLYCDSQDSRKRMNKDDRERLLLAALHHYTNIASHSEARGGAPDYARAEAKLILSLAAAFAGFRSNRT